MRGEPPPACSQVGRAAAASSRVRFSELGARRARAAPGRGGTAHAARSCCASATRPPLSAAHAGQPLDVALDLRAGGGIELAVEPGVEHLPQSRAVHELILLRAASSRCCSRSRPRARRDMTVPTGTPTIGADLLVGELFQLAQHEHFAVVARQRRDARAQPARFGRARRARHPAIRRVRRAGDMQRPRRIPPRARAAGSP